MIPHHLSIHKIQRITSLLTSLINSPPSVLSHSEPQPTERKLEREREREMNAMEISSLPSLEALVFDYVSFGIFNLWTWLALLTATLSFWKLRASAAASSSLLPLTSPSCVDKSEADPSPPSTSAPLLALTTPLPAAASKSSLKESLSGYDGFEDKRVTKGKFVAYYEDDDEGVSNINGGDDGSDDGESTMTVTERWGPWESMRMGEVGWYGHQDWSVINGNVVRLWDDVKRRIRNVNQVQQLSLDDLSFNYCCLVD